MRFRAVADAKETGLVKIIAARVDASLPSLRKAFQHFERFKYGAQCS